VDAVVSADPFMSRITDSGAGYVVSYYSTFLPDGQPTIITPRGETGWRRTPPRPGLPRGHRRGRRLHRPSPKNNDKVRAAIGKYIKLPPEVIAKVQISPPGPVVTEKQLTYWINLMKEQDMLKTTPDVTKLIVK
jgi:NitT/TauT family transport system substrate-binding protein